MSQYREKGKLLSQGSLQSYPLPLTYNELIGSWKEEEYPKLRINNLFFKLYVSSGFTLQFKLIKNC